MAFCLVLVIEGIAPFLNPKGLKQVMLLISQQDDRVVRLVGLTSMLVGATSLYLIN
ncbi:MAG: DUF2065 domain-containing protein [Pseudomonadota bacterium]|nr:DUF2065 domain-containing protein [Pseudomonadota bacterium]